MIKRLVDIPDLRRKALEYVYYYGSPMELVDDVTQEDLRVSVKLRGDKREDPWYGSVTHEEAILLVKKGNQGLAKKVEARKEFTEDLPETPFPEFELAIQGFIPVTGAYVSGEPECMVSVAPALSNQHPIRVFICATVMSSLTEEEVIERGATILSRVREIAARRPLELYLYSCVGGSISPVKDAVIAGFVIAKLETSPLNLQVAAQCLCHPSFLRRVLFAHSEKWGWTKFRGCGSDNGWGVHPDDRIYRESFRRNVRRVLNAQEHDLVNYINETDFYLQSGDRIEFDLSNLENPGGGG